MGHHDRHASRGNMLPVPVMATVLSEIATLAHLPWSGFRKRNRLGWPPLPVLRPGWWAIVVRSMWSSDLL